MEIQKITANEVRKGNWVYYEGRPFQIDTIADEFPTLNTVEFGIGVVDWNNIVPIPLSEEILLKAGFEKGKHGYWSLFLSINDMDRSSRKRIDFNSTISLCELCNVGVCFHRVDCNYVHQLQNLYFALTSQELKINF